MLGRDLRVKGKEWRVMGRGVGIEASVHVRNRRFVDGRRVVHIWEVLMGVVGGGLCLMLTEKSVKMFNILHST